MFVKILMLFQHLQGCALVAATIKICSDPKQPSCHCAAATLMVREGKTKRNFERHLNVKHFVHISLLEMTF